MCATFHVDEATLLRLLEKYPGRGKVRADGFYEWDNAKRRRYFERTDGEPFFLCGFCREETDGIKFVVLTKPADEPVAAIHGRMPVIVTSDRAREYLNRCQPQLNTFLGANLVFTVSTPLHSRLKAYAAVVSL